MKYGLINIETKCGEYEFTQAYLVRFRKDLEKRADEVAKTWYDDRVKNWDGGRENEYYFNGGELAVSVHSFEELTKKEYDVMKKYI